MNPHPKAEITFPAPWEFRIIAMGDQSASATQGILKVFHSFGFAVTVTPGKTSSGGKYQALHVSQEMPDRETLNAVSQELVKVPGVKMLI